MPIVSSEKAYNTFVKGFVTEVNPLTYPENASLDEDNFVLERNGSRSRRLGIDYEFGYTLKSTGLSAADIEGGRQSFHTWESPNEATDVHIGVIRIYNKLWFVNLLDTSPSASFLNSGNAITITGMANSELETAVINNGLILVCKDIAYPVLLTYNATTQAVTQENIVLSIRDFLGVDDGESVGTRPSTLSSTHRYNLRNQGWSTKIVSTCGTDALDCTFTTLGGYPANADLWSLGKVGDATSANFEKYDPNVMNRNSIDNATATRGSYIIDAFFRGTSRQNVSGISGLPLDSEEGMITSVASYAGRAFYSGVNSLVTGGDDKSPNYSSYLFFSQTVTDKGKLGLCYQEADPTSPTISDIIDTDGGTIQIPEITNVVRLIPVRSSLLIFAQNGIWELYGDAGGFTATSYQVSKISSIGISNKKSIVEANGIVYYFSNNGISVLVPDNISGRYKEENISLTTIQTYYNELSEISKNNARGFYDEREYRVRWLYNDLAGYVEGSYINKYNRELVFDTTLKAFYLQSIESLASNSPFVCDYIDIPGYTLGTVTEDVYVGTDAVLSGSDSIVVDVDIATTRTSQFSFLTIVGTSFTISKYTNSSFLDWYTADSVGVNYSSYLVTGYEIFGDIMRHKQTPYLFVYLQRTEDGFSLSGDDLILDNQSSCLVQAQWNWADSANSGKWGTQFQAYRLLRNYIPSGASDTFDYGYSVVVTKNKLRGSGRALSLKFSSEEGKDMKLYGWAVPVTGDGKP